MIRRSKSGALAVDVLEVQFDAFGPRQAIPAVDLRPSGEPRPHRESLALAVVASFELEWQHWSGTNDAHLASGHVDQLGEFVEREPAQTICRRW